MPFFQKRTAAIIAASVCYCVVTACSESRVVQCTQLLEVVNQGNALINSKKDTTDTATLKTLATALGSTVKQIQALPLTDTRLQGFQRQYIEGFQQLSQALSQISQALDKGKTAEATLEGRKQLNQAKGEVEKAGRVASQTAATQDQVTAEVAQYCRQR